MFIAFPKSSTLYGKFVTSGDLKTLLTLGLQNIFFHTFRLRSFQHYLKKVDMEQIL